MKMRRSCRPTAILFVLCGFLAILAHETLAADAAKAYAKKPTWAETMVATRANLAKTAEVEPLQFGHWHATGPIEAKGLSEALFPEQGIDLGAKEPDGKPVWQENTGWPDGQSHNLPGSHRASTYLVRNIKTARPTTVAAGFGSDDGMEVWLNGKKLISKTGVVPANGQMANLELKAGDNQLLFKIHNSGGSHSFYFATGDQADNGMATLWQKIEEDFPSQCGWMRSHLDGERHLQWLAGDGGTELEKELLERVIKELGADGRFLQGQFEQLVAKGPSPDDPRWLALYEQAALLRYGPAELKKLNLQALRLAIEDLLKTFGGKYARGRQYLNQLEDLERRVADVQLAATQGDRDAAKQVPGLTDQFRKLQKEALLDNPLLDFDRLLLVKRGTKQRKYGLPQNWQGNCAVSKDNYDNEIAVLSPVRPEGRLTTLFRPENGSKFVGDVDLHFDAGKMLFSMPGTNNRWQIWEASVDGQDLHQVTTGEHNDVDNYDACYLPDGRIIFDSTRCFQGVPCVGGGNTVANLCIMNDDGSEVRQLCFDQDHNWCPTVLNNGRILYSRWEYSDTPHYFSRLIFHMNPDGTNQAEYYGSNSLWPNSTFYARPIPNHPTMIIGVISGHHGVPRMGELVLFDPAKGRREADGAVQRIPGYRQKVQPKIADGLVNGSWPKFLHPYPLNDKYFLVSSQPNSQSLWGIYLVDIFDNMVLVKEIPNYVLFEPVPLRKTKRPPIIADKVNLKSKEAVVMVADVYNGPGLEGVPRGTVKKLRLFEQHYAYPRMGGHINIGIDGPWDVKRILGTVPVNSDGSASFRVPANTPIAVQPLDADGKAVQIMRSWFTAMPGEVLSCVGCHEAQNSTPLTRITMASRQVPSPIEPWYGPARGFGFQREVQPVLDKYCVGCHDGKHAERPNFARDAKSTFRNFTASYVALHPYVRRPGPESDYHLQRPMEFHANTSELIQMLEKGTTTSNSMPRPGTA